MKKLHLFAMLLALFSALLITVSTASAGGTNPTVPAECQSAVNSGRFRVVFAQPGVTTNAGSGSQVIIGTSGDDVINAGSGDDVVCGGGGNDTIDGGSGSDQLFGNGGSDSISGASGNDAINGGPGVDSCNGGTGTNTLTSCNDAGALENVLPGNCTVDGSGGFDCAAFNTGLVNIGCDANGTTFNIETPFFCEVTAQPGLFECTAADVGDGFFTLSCNPA